MLVVGNFGGGKLVVAMLVAGNFGGWEFWWLEKIWWISPGSVIWWNLAFGRTSIEEYLQCEVDVWWKPQDWGIVVVGISGGWNLWWLENTWWISRVQKFGGFASTKTFQMKV